MPQPPLAVPHLEIHVAHACNLACDNCSHYSDYAHKGIVSLEEADRWMGAWSGRIEPGAFSLVGGEPTIHPDLPGFVELAFRHFPRAHLRLVTNGFFLHRHPRLPEVLARLPDAALYLSIHHDSPEYREQAAPIEALVREWIARHGIRVVCYRSWQQWRQRYHGHGEAMMPFDDRAPRRSWETCDAKGCPQLFEGKLWKCSPLAYLRMQHGKVGLPAAWQAYLAYRPLEPGCPHGDLRRFFAREEEPACGMCPAEPRIVRLPIPLRAVARASTTET